MRIDVSEVKSYRGCKRQWKLSSRNGFHLRPTVTPPQLTMGTLFHESLHSLYLGVPVSKVLTDLKKEISGDGDACLLAMIPGYAKEVLPGDLDRYRVLDIEHKFDFIPTKTTGEVIDPDLHICGSIDMIVADDAQKKIYGFEHKTCKDFRKASFLWMDEQPRLYYYVLGMYVAEYNEKNNTDYEVGGVYLNEVKKLLRQFQYQRTLCTYPEDDMKNFMWAFVQSCRQCKHDVECDDPGIPSPSYFACQMCSYKAICETYMYQTLDKAELLKEFEDEFVEREEDHLDEKVERSK